MAPAPSSLPTLYVATNLSCWRTRQPERYGGDVWAAGFCHRELDPLYFAWLNHKVSLAAKAGSRGDLPEAVVAALRARLAEITAYAVERFGHEALEEAARSLDPRNYRPPKLRIADWLEDAFGGDERRAPRVPPGHCYPPAGDWPHFETIQRESIEGVDAIRERALALGWTEAELYQNRGRYRFPCGPDYGLVCFLGRGRSIAAVESDAIEIRTPGGYLLRFRKRVHEIPRHFLSPSGM